MTTKKNPKRVIPPPSNDIPSPSNELKDIAQKKVEEPTSINITKESTKTSWYFIPVGVVVMILGIAYFFTPKQELSTPKIELKQELPTPKIKPSRKF